VVTLTDEGTLVGGINKTRQQVIYHDFLGRVSETKIMNWEGTGSGGNGRAVYSATLNSYNPLDQLTLIRQYKGDDNVTNYQDTTLSYDGYSRLQTKHLPEQQIDSNNPASRDYTTWEYNPDDTIQKSQMLEVRIPRFTYNNNRGLANTVTYGLLPNVPTTGPSGVVSGRICYVHL
jgi:hypothetical protein